MSNYLGLEEGRCPSLADVVERCYFLWPDSSSIEVHASSDKIEEWRGQAGPMVDMKPGDPPSRIRMVVDYYFTKGWKMDYVYLINRKENEFSAMGWMRGV